MQYRDKPFISGWIIVFGFFLFMPIGIILAIVRSLNHKNQPHLKSMDGAFYGKFLLTLFVVLAILILIQGQQTDSPAAITVALSGFAVIFLLPAVIFLGRSRFIQRGMAFRYENYKEMIYRQELTGFDELAAKVGTKEIVVSNELQRMKLLGMLPDVFIDTAAGQALYQGSDEEDWEEEWDESPVEDQAAAARDDQASGGASSGTKLAECASCGAKTLLRSGESKECEYCGSVITYA
jgi:hypothetical protein